MAQEPMRCFLAPNRFQFTVTKEDYATIHAAYVSMCSVLSKNEQIRREAALWFSVDEVTSIVDGKRSLYWAQKIRHLDFAQAPFVVLTGVPPYKAKSGDTVLVLRLSGLTANQMAQLMVFLEQKIPFSSVNSSLQGETFLHELAARIANAWGDAKSHPELANLGPFTKPADFIFKLAFQ